MPLPTDPLAYLITFRTYGTWLHGDRRGSMSRRGWNEYGQPRIEPDPVRERADYAAMKQGPVTLSTQARAAVDRAIRDVCLHRGWIMKALNVRTNHVHVVVQAPAHPDAVMQTFKSYATRALREQRHMAGDVHPWSRHGSTKWLWDENQVLSAVEYVLYAQDAKGESD